MSLPKNAKEIVEFAKLGKLKQGVIKMPVLWSRRTNNKFGYWQIIVGIADRVLKTSEVEPKDTNGDWEGMLENWEAVSQDYIKREELPEGYVGLYWTRSGQEGGKETISKPTFVTTGKNEGKANYTTPFTQALRDAMTQYNAKVRKGHITSDAKQFIKKEGETYTLEELIESTHRGDYPWRVHVMTLHDVRKANNWRHITYPCFIQPKINGTHFVVVQHPELPVHEMKLADKTTIDTHLDWYSRGLESFAPQDHIMEELLQPLIKRPGLHVTGELWVKGSHLQDIAGSARRIKDPTNKSKRKAAIKQEFHIFDVFYINEATMPFEERNAIMEEIFEEMAASELGPPEWCHRVPTYEVDDKKQALTLYDSFIDEEYEGAVIRNTDSPYEVGVDKAKRSYTTLKIKPREDNEFEIVNFEDGAKGKDKGAVKWVCKTDKGNEFNATPNWTYEIRYAAFKALNKDKKWFTDNIKGEMATISSSEKSKDGTPQQPKFLQFRDPDIESKFSEFIGIEL